MKNQIIINILIIGIITLFSCNSTETESQDKNVISQEFSKNIKTVKAVLSNQEQELVLTGKVEYDSDKTISYLPLVVGVIDKSYFSLGDKVKKGQALFDMRSTELSALFLEKLELETEEEIAKRELKTTQSMFEDNILSEKELLAAKGKVKQIEAAINKIESDMIVYGTDKGDGTFTVYAPMSGYIVHKKASPGSMISPEGKEVFTIADLTSVWVTANVYPSNLLFVNEGMEVEITTLSYPGEIFYGKINSLSQVFDPEEKVLKARIIMDNSDLKLKPEMSMLVKVKNKNSQQLIAIPSDAIIFDHNEYFVVVKEVGGNFVINKVILQGHHNRTSYIASGLSENDTVVIENQLLIYSSLKGE